ncbi:MAG: efflux RND transporter periplasmic adaptor subunit [Nitrospiraceae bacterium]|jgi:RND family efflux transporter MFP subunit|nr:efflux RND transporter periplasmic adaptor subunit [Nitrospira sp.]MDW7648200.1 efflux RND transporter periplasmic adaptor subunit [Nitrospiraceae bacterium]MDW7654538.1 efflux RND transporter periplasmic adaptor subunit [Nitrospiraceae bacterium]GBL39410.1 macrolide export protein MacA [Nitrospirota bacterium]GDX88589.1 secretion protein HlyD [Nitrospirota bacterium]
MNSLKQHPIVTLGVIIFFAVTALVVFRLSSGAKSDVRNARVITVATATPLKQDLDIRLAYTADIIPNQVVNLFSRVDGYIGKIYVDKGDLVKASQLLVEIDHTDYQHAVNQAKANLAAARARVAQQDASVRNATLTLHRMRALIKDQFVSQQDLDNAQVSYDAAVAALDSLGAQVQQMAVAQAQAETNLAYSYIRAPFAGYVAERNLDLGAYVSGATAGTSTISRGILTLHEIQTVRILIEVVEKDVPLIQVGQKADVRAEAYPERSFEGTVTRIVQALNRATRTMTVEVDLPNKDHVLKGGMFARVEVLVGSHRNAIQIPIDAVSRLEDAQYVYIVREGKAQRMPVEIGVREDNRVEITKGLDGSEQVIVSGKDLVHDGTAVQTQSTDAVKGKT